MSWFNTRRNVTPETPEFLRRLATGQHRPIRETEERNGQAEAEREGLAVQRANQIRKAVRGK